MMINVMACPVITNVNNFSFKFLMLSAALSRLVLLLGLLACFTVAYEVSIGDIGTQLHHAHVSRK
jgi:hypothetical protein